MPLGRVGERLIVVGRVAGLFGVHGWIKVFSETDPRENILRYDPWVVGSAGESFRVIEGRRHGKGLVARLAGCDDRDQAAALVGREIAVRRDQLPPPQPDEFYWVDLEGLAVVHVSGRPLGQVERLFPTGANDVIVVRGERERLVPFVWGDVVRDVDFDAGRILVDWDPDF